VEYTVRDAPSSADSFLWSDSGEDLDLGTDARDDTYRTRFDEAGLQRVSVDVRDEFGRQVAEGELNIEAQEDGGTGGGGNGGDVEDAEIEVLEYPGNNGVARFRMGGDFNTRGFTFAWDFGDGESGAGRETEHQYTAVGFYTVTCTVSNSATGQEVAEDTATVALNTAGGRSLTTVPSMDEAAAMKEREY
jgi:hypothetical protein